MRLDKYICDNTTLTRSLATKAIKSGRIKVNGTKPKSGSQKIQLGVDHVLFDRQEVKPQPLTRYFMMNKPEGVVCANSDGDHGLVFDLMSSEINVNKLHTVGRLDKDTTGLLLVTDDGQWSHQITSPKHHKPKTYRTWLIAPLVDNAEQQVKDGILLKDEVKPTLPATLQRINDNEVLLTISEGRYHQVKRMFAALGNRVVRLHRESIGTLKLDSNLAPGEYRALTEAEVSDLIRV
ncbi:pseudouridine synthase [Pseudomonas sp. HK3]|jgi:16S rRNA pseudouridine516 synthase